MTKPKNMKNLTRKVSGWIALAVTFTQTKNENSNQPDNNNQKEKHQHQIVDSLIFGLVFGICVLSVCVCYVQCFFLFHLVKFGMLVLCMCGHSVISFDIHTPTSQPKIKSTK